MIEVSEINNQLSTNLFESLSAHNHEQILVCNDNSTGLKAIIAVHNTVLGPGLGGTRMWNYHNESEAMNDVLRLSRGMTYKASISGLNLGGAKAVIIGDAKTQKSEALMRRFGRFVNNLAGKYITAEDVGTTTRDMEYVAMETKNVVGLPVSRGGGGDPSPVTAYGVYVGIKASAKRIFGSDNLGGKKIAVMGVGKVGMHLLEYLHKEGAKFYVSDIHEASLKEASTRFGAIVVNGDEIYNTDAEIFAPCALGAVVNSESINNLKCAIIAGAANNQLENEEIHGPMLKQKGILYAPDFLINAGGLINVYSEWTGYNRDNAIGDTEMIYDTLTRIYDLSDSEGLHTQAAATKLAEQRIKDMTLVHANI
ncbi:MAG: leucine dehydrogenase [Bacteroidia bacterium]|jgi:leucine dehydrogenase